MSMKKVAFEPEAFEQLGEWATGQDVLQMSID